MFLPPLMKAANAAAGAADAADAADAAAAAAAEILKKHKKALHPGLCSDSIKQARRCQTGFQ